MQRTELNKALFGTLAVTALVAFTSPSFAAGRGGAGGVSGAQGNFGGMSSGHISNQGSLNTNGPNATPREFGTDRAQDRANANSNLNDTTATRHARNSNSTSTSGYDRAQDRMNANGTANSQAPSHMGGPNGSPQQ
jgi:hypothetical protein